MPLISDFLDDLMASLGSKDRGVLLDDIQEWAKKGAREGHIGPDTYDNYRNDADKEAQIGAALLLFEYLVSCRKPKLTEELYRKLREVVASKRRQRYARPFPHEDPASADAVERHAGVYALIRMESDRRKPCLELVILKPAEKKERLRLAVVVGRNLIMRGHWQVLGLSVCVTATGYRLGHQPDHMTLSFLQTELEKDLTGGVLTGLTTRQREPVTMSVIVHRVTCHPSILALGDQADAEIIQRFASAIPKRLTKKQLKFFEDVQSDVFGENGIVRKSWFDQSVIDINDPFITSLNDRDDFSQIVLPELNKLCRQNWE